MVYVFMYLEIVPERIFFLSLIINKLLEYRNINGNIELYFFSIVVFSCVCVCCFNDYKCARFGRHDILISWSNYHVTLHGAWYVRAEISFSHEWEMKNIKGLWSSHMKWQNLPNSGGVHQSVLRTERPVKQTSKQTNKQINKPASNQAKKQAKNKNK